MPSKTENSLFTSRYPKKKKYGSFYPWNGYHVTDSLSGKDYILFLLEPSSKATICLQDLKMRGHLFASGSEIMPSTMTLMEKDGSIYHLLPHGEFVPLSNALPAMKGERALEILGRIIAAVLEKLSTGLFFNNLSFDSLGMSEELPVILPASYLVPGEILSFMSPPGEVKRFRDPLISDLKALGTILSRFQKHIPPADAPECRDLAAALAELSAGTGPDDYYALLRRLVSFPGVGEAPVPGYSLRRDMRTPHETAMRKLRKIVDKAGGNEKHLVIVKGESGSGMTSFLEAAADNLIDEWGFSRGSFIGDQEIFQNFEGMEDSAGDGFTICDDHMQEVMLCSYIIDRLSRDLENRRLAIVSIDESTPQTFYDGLTAEGAANGFTVDEIGLSAVDERKKAGIIGNQLSPGLREAFVSGGPAGGTFTGLDIAARVLTVYGRDQFEKTLKNPAGHLTPEERSVLDFIATFRFEVPLSILQSVYPTEENGLFSILHRLVTSGMLRTRAESSLLSANRLCIVYSVSSKTLSKRIHGSIPAARRKEIHRNIVQILKDNRNAPLVYIFYHLVGSREVADAAYKGIEIFHLLLGRKKINAIKCFSECFMDSKLDRNLPPEIRFRLYLELGDYFSLIGDIDKAERLYRRCREESSRNEEWQKLRTLAVEAVRRECEILEKRGDFKKAETLLKKAIDTHGEHILSSDRAKLYNDLSWVHYRLGQFNESWENCLIVHKMIDKKENPRELAQSYNLMGAINWNRSKYDEALLWHKKCLALREECNDERGIGASHNNLGLVYRSMGRIKDALDSFTKSMKIKQRNNNLPGLAAAHLNLALTYLDLEEIEKAEKNCQIADKLAGEMGNQQLIAEIAGTMGEISFLKGDYQASREHFFRDLHICHKTRSMREKAIVFRRLGELSLAEGKIDEAAGLLSQARTLNQKIGSRLETILLDLLEGRIQLAEGRRESGRMKLEGTSFELSLLGKKSTAASVAAEIGELYLEEGNSHLAREYLLRAIALVGETDRMPRQVRSLQTHLEQRSSVESTMMHSDSGRFRALCRIISFIRTIPDSEKLYRTVTETARKITGMERAALVLQNEGQETYSILASVGEFESEGILTDKNMISILNVTRQLGYPLDISRTNIPEGKISEEFLARHPGVICTPLWIQDEVTGFLYLDSSQSNIVATDEDHSFLVAFSQQVALGLERIILSERLEDMQRSRTVSPPTISAAKERVTFQDIIGKSPAMRHVYEMIESIKDMDTTVLLTGPNGSGKDLIAKAIHFTGPRSSKPFHPLNCAAFPPSLLESELFGHERGAFTGAHKQKIGHFESASGGTIFLNEIGEIPLALQAKLLHVLEEQRFFRVGGTREIKTDVRILTATNKNLKELVRQGTFREDLYYRINVFPIRIPPLRERREDIKLLCNHFLTTSCRLYNIPTKRISPEAMTYLMEYEWPGNVRELENTINRLIILSRKDTILPEDLPEGIIEHTETVHAQSLTTLDDVIDTLLDTVEFSTEDPVLSKVEKSIIRKVVDRTGDKTKAAGLLGISKPTLYSRLKKND